STPNIDRLAAGGLSLTQYYSNAPICSPSRVALSTGQYPQRWRIHSYLDTREHNARRKMANFLDSSAVHTARIFKDAGFRTAHFGKWHMGGGRDVDDAPLPTSYGFDETIVALEGLGDRIIFPESGIAEASEKLGHGRIIAHAPKREMTMQYVDHAIDFLQRTKNAPFYLEVYPNDVHGLHYPLPEDAARFASVTSSLAEQKFFAVLGEMDRQLGRLLDELDRLDLAKNTIVILTSDNGPSDAVGYYRQGGHPPGSTGPFFGRKGSLYEGGIRMPFIIRWPGHTPANQVDNQTIAAGIDLQPTLCALAGVAMPSGKVCDGLDISAAFLGRSLQRTQPIFWEFGVNENVSLGRKDHRSPKLAMRDGNWKFLIDPDGSRAELYDLSTDLAERHNLAPRLSSQTVVFSARTMAWWSDIKRVYGSK
ncbi:MAG: sulfatase-like hydrolase/transferase, partial [Bryobacterales bacterium]|nr:sulfatase-like hydrolase/transferase [Bryobacterales bacterium]